MSLAHLTRMRATSEIIIQPLERHHLDLLRDAAALIAPLDNEEIQARLEILEFLDGALLDAEAAEEAAKPKLRSV